MTFDLERFVRAQGGAVGFELALREIETGGKRSHWIWYIFPQLAGLGHSPAAMAYGLQGVAEAAAYLRQPVLRDRLLTAASAVLRHLQREPPVSLRLLIGSDLDVLKLVSSMTLFRAAARQVGDDPVAAAANEILQSATQQGFDECEFTRNQTGP
jgi:uncharacterized protein (DUF1810 family)